MNFIIHISNGGAPEKLSGTIEQLFVKCVLGCIIKSLCRNRRGMQTSIAGGMGPEFVRTNNGGMYTIQSKCSGEMMFFAFYIVLLVLCMIIYHLLTQILSIVQFMHVLLFMIDLLIMYRPKFNHILHSCTLS